MTINYLYFTLCIILSTSLIFMRLNGWMVYQNEYTRPQRMFGTTNWLLSISWTNNNQVLRIISTLTSTQKRTTSISRWNFKKLAAIESIIFFLVLISDKIMSRPSIKSINSSGNNYKPSVWICQKISLCSLLTVLFQGVHLVAIVTNKMGVASLSRLSRWSHVNSKFYSSQE